MKTNQYIKDIGNFVQREQESLPEAWERLQEIIRSCPHHGFSQQRLVHIFNGGVSSHNRTILDATCGGNLMLNPLIDAIKIIKDMRSNPYNNLGDMGIMKNGINQVEKDDSQTELGKHMQALTLKIKTLMKAQAQAPIITPLFLTCDRCRIVHRPGECTIDDKLATTMDEINFVKEGIVLIINTPTISIMDRASGRIKECIGLNLCKIRGLDKRIDSQLFKKPCFNI